jgi:hypothetical protein
MKAIGAIVAGLGLAGCVAVGPDGPSTGHYLGYVRVTDPGGNGVSAVGLGLRRLERATVSPEACGLTIIVSSDDQLAAVEGLIRRYAEGQACTVRRNSGD